MVGRSRKQTTRCATSMVTGLISLGNNVATAGDDEQTYVGCRSRSRGALLHDRCAAKMGMEAADKVIEGTMMGIERQNKRR